MPFLIDLKSVLIIFLLMYLSIAIFMAIIQYDIQKIKEEMKNADIKSNFINSCNDNINDEFKE